MPTWAGDKHRAFSKQAFQRNENNVTFLLLSYRMICLTFSFKKHKKGEGAWNDSCASGTVSFPVSFQGGLLPGNYKILERGTLHKATFHENMEKKIVSFRRVRWNWHGVLWELIFKRALFRVSFVIIFNMFMLSATYQLRSCKYWDIKATHIYSVSTILFFSLLNTLQNFAYAFFCGSTQINSV